MSAMPAVIVQRTGRRQQKNPSAYGTDPFVQHLRCAGPRDISGGCCNIAPASCHQWEPRAKDRRRSLCRRPSPLACPLCLSGVCQRHRHEPRWETEGGRNIITSYKLAFFSTLAHRGVFGLSCCCSRPPETHAQLPRGLRGDGRRHR